jgi:hypothetical protein
MIAVQVIAYISVASAFHHTVLRRAQSPTSSLDQEPERTSGCVSMDPFIGSTFSYGIDPYEFFVQCQEKVLHHAYTHRPESTSLRWPSG